MDPEFADTDSWSVTPNPDYRTVTIAASEPNDAGQITFADQSAHTHDECVTHWLSADEDMVFDLEDAR
jgi:hypothetical protein